MPKRILQNKEKTFYDLLKLCQILIGKRVKLSLGKIFGTWKLEVTNVSNDGFKHTYIRIEGTNLDNIYRKIEKSYGQNKKHNGGT